VTDYLTLADVLAIHYDLIERYGGSHGIRDPGALEAALYRPQSGYYGGILEEAAALWESLSQNHPFLDGNKRVAFAAVYTLLRTNGIDVTASASDTYTFIARLYRANTFEFSRLLTWLRKNTQTI
jgi:death-on-curing protein